MAVAVATTILLTGHELLTIIVRFAPIQVSTLDPASTVASDMSMARS